jgi:phosphatidylserine/phosphatidylglycerophosphate/cardiolipin synthase-like enzyme/V8-like Glu-specific endopeptidase
VTLESTSFQQWFDSLSAKDSPLYNELKSKLDERLGKPELMGSAFESTGGSENLKVSALETIVRDGRPAIPILENRISFKGAVVDAAAEVIVNRLRQAVPTVEPCIPLVGRIDVDNFPGSLTYVGTGWLVDKNIAVTNRHVAELIAQSDDGIFRFRPGRFGDQLQVNFDYRHELGLETRDLVRVERVLWIERDSHGPDIAFLKLDRRTDGTTKPFIPLAESDARAKTEVVVIGYPARAPEHIIPNQAWMDQIYDGAYDVKRIAPGMIGNSSRGWSTHDCTTLGGNSGSVVVDMNSGKAVALHFAGLYMIENYAVPASTIRKYLDDRPWQGESVGRQRISSDGKVANTNVSSDIDVRIDQGEVVVTIPITVTVSIGKPRHDGAKTETSKDSVAVGDSDAAARELYREHRVDGVYTVWAGYEIKDGRLTDTECLVVSAHPERITSVREAMPRTFGGFPVDVRPASIDEMMEAAGVLEATAGMISYNDDARTGEEFSFDWVEEEMTVQLHVGPERSWSVLSKFLQNASTELVSSMYEFHAAHIAEAIQKDLQSGAAMTLVLARQSRDPRNNQIAKGDFDRSETFARWEQAFKEKFNRIFVPLGTNGLVALSYHIKVTVADDSKVWLSSGNWKRSSQPLIPAGSLDDPSVTGKAGNREWHVVIENDTLAKRFKNHIKADFVRSKELGGNLEAVDEEPLIDVPLTVLESVELEGAPARVLKPLRISKRLRVKPLLTPDQKGAVFSEAVLELIRSAKHQLLFQNQYIKMKGADAGFFKQLIDALVAKSQELSDFRIILRRENDSLPFDLSQLKRRGVAVDRQVRLLANTHTKGIIVDGRGVLLGSHNWSSLGVTLNRDASLIFEDEEVAQYYAEAFEIDWDRGNEPRFSRIMSEGVVPADGTEPPQGYVRMTLSDYLEEGVML